VSEPADGAQSSRPRVALVFGGRSSEHGVSCLTAGEVARVIDSAAYEVVPVGIATDGRWVLESFDGDRLALHDGRLPIVDAARADVVLAPDPSRRELVVGAPGDVPEVLGQVDVVFPLLHGPWGEDGTLQGLLEMAGVRYVGAGVLASAIGMDKPVLKAMLTAAGLPVLPSVVVPAPTRDLAGIRQAVDALGYPVFVKPARAGSSMGISRVERAADLDAAIEEARQHDPKVLVEPGVLGARELECGVLERLDGGRPEPSVVGEVSLAPGSGHAFYDFTAKYVDGTARIDVPADLPAEVSDRIRELAVRAFEAIGCEGLARVDFFLLPDGEVVINEANTMPGFTATSMFPMLWQASGVDYAALVDRLLRLALNRPTGLR
jgi:D-alanine-D-alanine ligase